MIIVYFVDFDDNEQVVKEQNPMAPQNKATCRNPTTSTEAFSSWVKQTHYVILGERELLKKLLSWSYIKFHIRP